jgi:hypothetical protein
MSEPVITVPAPSPAAAQPWPGVHWWHKAAGFGFHDVLDTLNPLQHIPILSTFYRRVTQDQPGAVARIIGDGLYGGGPIGSLIGLASGLVNVLVQADTGKDLGEHALALVGLDGDDKTALDAAAAAPVAAAVAQRAPIALSPTRYRLPKGPPPGSGGAAAPEAAAATPAVPVAAPAQPAGPSLLQRPIPLAATGLLLPGAHPRPLPAGPPAAAAPGEIAAPAKVAAPTAGGAPQDASAPNPDQALDISEKMSEALDKYARMMQQRQGTAPPGGQVNLVQ